MLGLLAVVPKEMHAQNDAYFQEKNEFGYRSPKDVGCLSYDGVSFTGGYGFTFGINFDNFDSDLNNSLKFGEFIIAEDDVPLGNGMLLLFGFALVRGMRRLGIDNKTKNN